MRINEINEKNINLFIKPIISVINKKIIGYETVNCGIAIDGEDFSVEDTIGILSNKEDLINIDRMYREKSAYIFSNEIKNIKNKLLFLDINLGIISHFLGSGVILDLIEKYNLKPHNVVLNIKGNGFNDTEDLKDFIIKYRSIGFLIALSDIGSGFANLDKISFFEPDIIIISKNITESIEEDYYKQEVFKSLVNLSKNIGALVIADGINSIQTALTLMDLGADMLEGDCIGKFDVIDEKVVIDVKQIIEEVADNYKKYMKDKINFEKINHQRYEKVITNIKNQLSKLKKGEFDKLLAQVILENNDFECIYVLNESGIQVTDTLTKYKDVLSQKALIFHPAEKNTNHSLKKYYYFLKNMVLEKYITEPYISLATGNLCITVSQVFSTPNDENYILCIDFNPNNLNII
ncbi:EAL domain-containing protein [Clostridium sp. DL1XJH146]